MALNISHPSQASLTRADTPGRTVRRRHLVLAMATGVFAIVVGAWHWAPDNDAPATPSAPGVSIVSSPASP